MIKTPASIPILLAITGLLLSCQVPDKLDGPVALKPSERQQLAATAKDPRRFSITTYQSDSGPVFEGSFRFHPNQLSENPFLRVGEDRAAPVIEARSFADVSYRALLDTSSPDSWVTLNTFGSARMALIGPPLYRQEPVHVPSDVSGYLAVASTFRLGMVQMESALLYVQAAMGPFGNLARNIDPKPEVIIGNDILQRLGFVRIDYPGGLVTFSSDKAYSPEDGRVVGQASYTMAKGSLAVNGRIEGVQTRIILDSAGEYGLAMPESGTNRIRQLEIGSLVLRDVPATPAETQSLSDLVFPRVGARILRRYVVVLDPRNRQVLFERPTDAP